MVCVSLSVQSGPGSAPVGRHRRHRSEGVTWVRSGSGGGLNSSGESGTNSTTNLWTTRNHNRHIPTFFSEKVSCLGASAKGIDLLFGGKDGKYKHSCTALLQVVFLGRKETNFLRGCGEMLSPERLAVDLEQTTPARLKAQGLCAAGYYGSPQNAWDKQSSVEESGRSQQ